MGIIAWIAVGMAAGLLANMLVPGKRPRGFIFICLACFTGALGGDWAASNSPAINAPQFAAMHQYAGTRRRPRPPVTAVGRLWGYLGSEQSGLLPRLTTRLLPGIRRSGPRRHID